MNINIPFTDPKVIARQYFAVGSLLFLLGCGLTFFMKRYLSSTSDAYFKLEEMHGTVLVFFGIVPVVFAGFGYWIMPLSHGSRMYFPRLDAIGLVLFYFSAVLMLVSLFVPGTFIFILAMSLNIPFAITCSVNFIATIIYLSRSRMKWTEMRSLVWTLFVTSLFLFSSFLLLEIAALMQIANDFRDSGLWATPPPIGNESVLSGWRRIFWFLGHPEVYILLLTIIGATVDGIRLISKRPIFRL